MSKVEEKIRRFRAADERLNEFHRVHSEMIEKLSELVTEREAARAELENAVCDSKESVLGMKPQTVTTKIYDGEALYRLIEDEELRKEVITIEYKIDRDKLRRAIRLSRIAEDVENKATRGEKSHVVIKNRIPKYGLA